MHILLKLLIKYITDRDISSHEKIARQFKLEVLSNERNSVAQLVLLITSNKASIVIIFKHSMYLLMQAYVI